VADWHTPPQKLRAAVTMTSERTHRRHHFARGRLLAAAAAAATILVLDPLSYPPGTRSSRAQLGQNGAPLITSRYAVDLSQGPVVTSTRVIGMAGAYVAIAEGAEGNFVNPVAPAVRQPWSLSALDYDVGLGLTFPNTLQRSDFFNSGADRTNLSTSNPREFVFFDAEGHLQWRSFGIGSAFSLQSYGLRRTVSTVHDTSIDQLKAQFLVGYLQAAHAAFSGQLLLGAGVRLVGLSVSNSNPRPDESRTLFGTGGLGYQLGILVRPNRGRIRLGAVLRTTVDSRATPSSTVFTDSSGNRILAPATADQMYLPDQVSLPWDLNLGLAVQFGARRFNPEWLDPSSLLAPARLVIAQRRAVRGRANAQRLELARRRGEDEAALLTAIQAEDTRLEALEREELAAEASRIRALLKQRASAMQRFYVLVSSSILIQGPTPGAVGIESFLQRVVDRSGQRTVVSPRLVMESEVLPQWLKLRLGCYGEPTRFSNPRAAPRLHTTFGFEQKLLNWSAFGLYDKDSQWRIQSALDLSERYTGFSASVGIWH